MKWVIFMINFLERVKATKNIPWDYDIYEIIENNLCVGHIVYRYGSDEKLKYAGHIGYTIDEEYRGHGYAYQALKELLSIISKETVIITCDLDNIASQKTIEKCEVISKEKLLEIEDEEYRQGLWRYVVKKR